MAKVTAMERTLFLFVVVVALVVAGATPAMADIQSVGGPGLSPSDWYQEWNESYGSSGLLDNLEMFIETPGVVFDNPSGITFGTGGWAGTNVNPQYSYASGPAVSFLDFYTNFASALSVPFTMDFYATLGGTVVDSAALIYDGQGTGNDPSGNWTQGSAKGLANENTSPVPEPTSILFMGTVLLGLAGALKRKWA